MNRFICTLIAAAALIAPAVASAQFQMPGDIVVTPPPGGWDIRCETADLASTIVDVRDYGYGHWRYVVVEVTNDGRTDFDVEAGRAAVLLSVGDYQVHTRDITFVAAGESVLRAGWVQLPQYAGPDGEPEFGQCSAEATINARISYDPDLGLDGDPAARDCRQGNNLDQATEPYLVHCPW